MNTILPGTIEDPGLDTYKVGTLEAPSGGVWLALEAVRLTLYWLRAQPAFASLVAGTRAERH
jgi:hypothetical protein